MIWSCVTFLIDAIIGKNPGSVFLEELNWIGQINLRDINFTIDISVNSIAKTFYNQIKMILHKSGKKKLYKHQIADTQ